MPVVAIVAPGESFAFADGTKVTYRIRNVPVGPRSEGSDPPGSLLISCSLDGVEGASYEASTCPPLTLRHDAKSDIWLAAAGASLPFAFKGNERRSRDIDVDDVRASIAPDASWILGGLVGSAVGSLLFALAVRLEQRRASLDAIEGTMGADQWVTVPGHAPVNVPDAAAFAPGPILLCVHGGNAASYRSSGAGSLLPWRSGTLEDARAAMQGRAVSLYAFALTWAALCSAPLLLSR